MMASLGSAPFLVETHADTTVQLLHTGDLKIPPNFSTINASVFTRGFDRGRLKHRCGRGLLCPWGTKHIRALGKSSGTSEEDKDESEEMIKATIEKGKKVLALQRELLLQIAEGKKLVSSINSDSIPEPEGNSVSYEPSDKSPLSDSDPQKASASRDNSFENQRGGIALTNYVNSSKREIQNVSSVSIGQDSDEVDEEDNKFSPAEVTSSKQYFNEQLKTKRYETISPKTLPTVRRNSIESSSLKVESLKGVSQPNLKEVDKGEKEDNKFSPAEVTSSKQYFNEQLKTKRYETISPKTLPNDRQNSIESSSLMVESLKGASQPNLKEVANDAESEGGKSPPLAGANVMNIILVAAECAPWSKTGGLGDVAGSLPKALARRGHRVMIVAPRYGNYAEAQDMGVRKRYKVDGQDMEVTYFHAYIDGVDFVFIDSPIFRHLEQNIYGGNRVDILRRMVLFCKAAAEVCWHVPCGGVCYGDGNLVYIANDWHTALLPVYLKAYYRDHGLMQYTRSVLVIHNIAHQGRGPLDDFRIVDLPENYMDLFKLYDPLGGEHFNIFAAGLKTADRIVTVSHGYAWELKTSEGGWGLHGIINENDWKFRGIVNGIDSKDWNPQFDVHLTSDGYTNYTLETLHSGKRQCKAALQKELGLPVREDVPVIGFIGRLDHQKGVDLIAEAIPWMMGQDVQLIMLGTGRPDLEEMLRQFESQHRDKVRGWVGFSVKTAHRITAGVDILLMPSRFEPCGLNQLYAMNYGTVPVVHAVGGLRDTVQAFNPFEESGLGWTFDSAEADKLIHALGNCLWTFREYKKSWEGLQKRGMSQDLSWDNAAQQYEEVLVAAKYQW